MNHGMTTLGLLPNIGMWEMMAIGVVLLLLFGRRLPEVGKSLGQGIVQFKKGLRDVEDEVKTASREPDQIEQPRTPTNGGQDQRVSQTPADSQ